MSGMTGGVGDLGRWRGLGRKAKRSRKYYSTETWKLGCILLEGGNCNQTTWGNIGANFCDLVLKGIATFFGLVHIKGLGSGDGQLLHRVAHVLHNNTLVGCQRV